MTFPPPPGPQYPSGGSSGEPAAGGFGGFGSPVPPQGPGVPPLPSAPPGGPATWQQLSPEQLTHLHQPGIVPLRPLTLGDIFGGALQTMRRNPVATIGMAFIVLAVFLVPSFFASLALARVAPGSMEDKGVLVNLGGLLFNSLASIALTGLIVYVVSEAVLGDRVGLGETWQKVRGRMPALVGSLLLISGLFIAVLLALFVFFLGLASTAQRSPGVAVALAIIAGIGAFLLMTWAGCRLSLAPGAVVLEKAGPWRGITRAWSLSSGRQSWRILGITLLAGVLTAIFSSMVQVPLLIAMTVVIGNIFGDVSPVHPAILALDHLTTLVVQAFTIPFSAGVTALLYLDQRVRREGLDVTLYHAAQARVAARQR